MNRVESFSDGVIAVIITIMVLELKVPADATLAGLYKVVPALLAYVLSFVTVGIMWANHHHLLKAARRPDPALLWTNNNLLFWMSLVPFATAYLAAHAFEPIPVVLYGAVCMMMGLGFAILRHFILAQHLSTFHDAPALQRRLMLKNILAAAGYLAAGLVAFRYVWVSYAIFAAVPISYFIPDRSLEEFARKNRE